MVKPTKAHFTQSLKARVQQAEQPLFTLVTSAASATVTVTAYVVVIAVAVTGRKSELERPEREWADSLDEAPAYLTVAQGGQGAIRCETKDDTKDRNLGKKPAGRRGLAGGGGEGKLEECWRWCWEFEGRGGLKTRKMPIMLVVVVYLLMILMISLGRESDDSWGSGSTAVDGGGGGVNDDL